MQLQRHILFTMFDDRQDAGRQLAQAIRAAGLRPSLIVGLPRGGMVVADVVASVLSLPLDVFVVGKMTAEIGRRPRYEVAIGAGTAVDGDIAVQRALIGILGIDDFDVATKRKRLSASLAEREALYRAVRAPANIKDASIVVVDDGISTGITMTATLRVLRRSQPMRLAVAVPVAGHRTSEEIALLADELVVLETPMPTALVGAAYHDFDPVTDTDVISILRRQ